MNWIFILVSVSLLGILAFQDFRYRAISWYLLPLLLLAFLFSGSRHHSLSELGLYFGVNLCFILLQLALLTVYFSLKNRRIIYIIDRYIGLGDILFFLVICAAFSPLNFILFYTICLVLSLMVAVLYHLILKAANKTIPLAGIFSVILIVIFIADGLKPFSFYNDDLLLSSLTFLSPAGEPMGFTPFRAGAN